MVNAIDQYLVVGVETTLDFCRFVMGHSAFRSGKFDTHFVNDHFRPELLSEMRTDEQEIAALMSVYEFQESKKISSSVQDDDKLSLWKANRAR